MVETVKMEGFEAVRLALLDTPKSLRKKVIHAILRKAAQPILREAKANAPVAKKSTKRVIPGLIKKTLGVTRSRLRSESRGEFGVFITARKPGQIKRLGRVARKSGARGPNFGDPFYHRFQEAGTKHMRAKQYLGAAFAAHKNQAVGIIQSDLVKATVAAFEKRAKK